MPRKFVGVVVPVADVSHGGGRIFFQNLVTTVFLRRGEGLIGVHLEESGIENLSGCIAGVVSVLVAGGDSARRSVGRVAAGPEKWFHPVLRGGSEAGSPYRRFAILAIAVGGSGRFDPEWFYVRGVIAGGDKCLLKGRASSQHFWWLGFRLGLDRLSGVGVATRQQRENQEYSAGENPGHCGARISEHDSPASVFDHSSDNVGLWLDGVPQSHGRPSCYKWDDSIVAQHST